jgi:hypothetical protein
MKFKLCAVFALFACATFAQSITQTTLAQNAAANHPQIVVASASGITAGMQVFASGEAMTVTKVIGNTLAVTQGIDGTRAIAHNSGDTVYAAPQSAFRNVDPVGSCATLVPVNPWINVTANRVWSCINGAWTEAKTALAVSGLPIYANNAAAIAGGLSAGAFYRSGGDPDHVLIVH